MHSSQYLELLENLKHSDRIPRLLDQMTDLHVRKSAGYAGLDNPDPWANFREAQDFGITPFVGVMVRASDKWVRTKNLARNPENDQVGEDIKETLKDLASYCLIAICLMEEAEQANQPYLLPANMLVTKDSPS